MKTILIAASFLISTTIFANVVFDANCSLNYGLGIDLGYNGTNSPIQDMNDPCFVRGKLTGQIIKDHYFNDAKACYESYQSGYNYGINAEILTIEEPYDCSNAGYIFAQSYLITSARTQNVEVVGQECVNAYKTGFEEAKTHIMNSSYSTNIGLRCHQIGFSDGLMEFSAQ